MCGTSAAGDAVSGPAGGERGIPAARVHFGAVVHAGASGDHHRYGPVEPRTADDDRERRAGISGHAARGASRGGVPHARSGQNAPRSAAAALRLSPHSAGRKRQKRARILQRLPPVLRPAQGGEIRVPGPQHRLEQLDGPAVALAGISASDLLDRQRGDPLHRAARSDPAVLHVAVVRPAPLALRCTPDLLGYVHRQSGHSRTGDRGLGGGVRPESSRRQRAAHPPQQRRDTPCSRRILRQHHLHRPPDRPAALRVRQARPGGTARDVHHLHRRPRGYDG